MSKEFLPYMPILKLKKAELRALSKLRNGNISMINPLIQILPTSENQIGVMNLDLLDYSLSLILNYSTMTKIYLDFSMICDKNFNKAIECISYKKTIGEKCDIIPVINGKDFIESSLSTQSVSFLNERGLCLRVDYENFINLGWWTDLRNSITKKILNTGKIYILIDFKNLNNNALEIVNLLKNKEIVNGWKSLYIAMGAFPQTFKELPYGESIIDRRDYSFWRNIYGSVSNIGYADYTVQYPYFKPSVPGYMNPTISVSYTGEEVFHIFKGYPKNSKLVEKPLLQYFAHAILLTSTSYFKGREYAYGDEYIQEKANLYTKGNQSNTGNFTDWLAASINHHITLTIDQITHIYNDR